MASGLSAAEQLKFIKANYDSNAQPQEGEKWFPINAEWFDQLLSYLNGLPAADGSPTTKPGKIDNSNLSDDTIAAALKRGLVSAACVVDTRQALRIGCSPRYARHHANRSFHRVTAAISFGFLRKYGTL